MDIIKNVGSANLDKLLRSNNDFYYEIPVYQRTYSWNSSHCIDLIDDIVTAFTSKSDGYFIGALILSEGSSDTENRYGVIDGQQRLSTLILLFKAIYSLCLDNNKKVEKIFEDEGGLRLISKVNENENKDNLEKIIKADRDCLKKIIDKNVTSKGKNSLISYHRQNAYEANFYSIYYKLDSIIKELNIDLMELSNFMLNNIFLVYTICTKIEDGLIIFNSFNSRGLPLTNSDIIKGYICANFSDDNKINEFIKEWIYYLDKPNFLEIFTTWSIINSIKNDNFAFRHKFNESTLKYIRNHLDKNSDYFWEEIKNLYKELVEVEISRELYLINQINIKWFYAYKIFKDKYNANDFNIKIKELIKSIAKISLFNMSATNTVKRNLGYRLANDVFSSNVNILEYYKNSDLSDLYKIINNNYKVVLDFHMVYNEEEFNQKYQDGFFNNLDIEHILPKKYQDIGSYVENWTEDQYYECINSLGNLIKLEKGLNIAAGNKRFSEKIKYYKESKIKVVEYLVNIEKWDMKELEKREDKIILDLKNFLTH